MCFTFSRASGSLLVWRAPGQLGDANRWSHRYPFGRFRQECLYGKNEGGGEFAFSSDRARDL